MIAQQIDSADWKKLGGANASSLGGQPLISKVQQSSPSKPSSPVHLAIANRSFHKKSAKNLNQYVVSPQNEEY